MGSSLAPCSRRCRSSQRPCGAHAPAEHGQQVACRNRCGLWGAFVYALGVPKGRAYVRRCGCAASQAPGSTRAVPRASWRRCCAMAWAINSATRRAAPLPVASHPQLARSAQQGAAPYYRPPSPFPPALAPHQNPHPTTPSLPNHCPDLHLPPCLRPACPPPTPTPCLHRHLPPCLRPTCTPAHAHLPPQTPPALHMAPCPCLT